MQNSAALLHGLVVDDNDLNRMVAAEMLESHGIDTEEAVDGRTGWALLREKKYQLVLLDINMPGIDGKTVCRNVRQHALNSDTYIVAYTAHAFPEQKEEYIAAGFDDLLTKPISYDGLAQAIRPVIGQASEGGDINLDFLGG